MNRFQFFFHNNNNSSFLSSIVTLSVRHMSKHMSKAATKRMPLNTKRARKGYYKGKGGTKEGRITSKGRFIVDPQKRLELIIPDLEGFKVRDDVFCRVSSTQWQLSISNAAVYFIHSLQLKPYVALGAGKIAPELRNDGRN